MAMPLDPPPSGVDPSPPGSGAPAGEPAERVQVVRLDAVEVVLGLGVLHPEHRVGVSLPIDVRDAPIVADDGDVARLALPAGDVRALAEPGEAECEQCADGVHGDGDATAGSPSAPSPGPPCCARSGSRRCRRWT